MPFADALIPDILLHFTDVIFDKAYFIVLTQDRRHSACGMIHWFNEPAC